MLLSDPVIRKARAKEKAMALLKQAAGDGFITTENASDLLGVARPATLKTLSALARMGYLVRDEFWDKGRLKAVWGITTHGLALSDEEIDRPVYEKGRISTISLAHTEFVQKIRIRAEKSGWTHWIPGHRLRNIGLRKVPDAQGQTPKGARIAVEAEREIKTRKRYANIISAYLQEIKSGRWDYAIYVTPDGLADRLERVFSSIIDVPVAGQRIRLEHRHRDRFRFLNLNEWPGGLDYEAVSMDTEP